MAKKIYHFTEKEIKIRDEQRLKVKNLKKGDINKAIKRWQDSGFFQCWACNHCSFMHEYDEEKLVNLPDTKNGKPCIALCLLGYDTMKMRKGKYSTCYGFLFFKKLKEK